MIREGLTFDDVLLVPQHSEIISRSNIDLSIKIKDFTFEQPIIPANMKTIIDLEMAKVVYQHGGLGILHRFMPLKEQLQIINLIDLTDNFNKNVFNHIGLSIGVKPEDKATVDAIVDVGVKILCIDVAHGDSAMCIDMCKYISTKHPHVLLIAGNVATGSGARRLWLAGADIVKVGVGPGSLCTTRIETGNGVPQLSALMDVAAVQKELREKTYNTEKFPFIADGGIKNAGDIVKALCFADMVMAGNIFAGCDETPGHITIIGGVAYKSYVGSSTHKANHIEGVAARVPVKGKFSDILTKLLEGLRSGCSYQGADNLSELKDNPTFIKITNAGLKESHPHDVILT